MYVTFSDDELARELEHSDSNDDESQDISMEMEDKLLGDEPECMYYNILLCNNIVKQLIERSENVTN